MKAKVTSIIATLLLIVGVGGTAFAAEGYRGTNVYGCQAYISGSKAWTNCRPATRSFEYATKAWRTGQPTRMGPFRTVSRNSNVTGVSEVGCTFNVHTAQTKYQ